MIRLKNFTVILYLMDLKPNRSGDATDLPENDFETTKEKSKKKKIDLGGKHE